MRITPYRAITKLLAATLLLCLLTVVPARAAYGWQSDRALPVPSAGEQFLLANGAEIDYSHLSQGYVMVRYQGPATKMKVQITKAGGKVYSYDLNSWGEYETYSFSQGSGSYTVNVFQHVYDNRYASIAGLTLEVALEDELLPFLYPNQHVNFSAQSQAAQQAAELATGASGRLETVELLYNRVMDSLAYDYQKAEEIAAGRLTGYLPDVDAVLAVGMGICFDYTALLAAMLRSVGIPARLEMGYVSGGVYHAWVSVLTGEAGWINGTVYTDGTSWLRLDPTFADSVGSDAGLLRYVGDGSGYQVSYVY